MLTRVVVIALVRAGRHLRPLNDEEPSFGLSQAGFDYLDERFDAAQIDRLMAEAARPERPAAVWRS